MVAGANDGFCFAHVAVVVVMYHGYLIGLFQEIFFDWEFVLIWGAEGGEDFFFIVLFWLIVVGVDLYWVSGAGCVVVGLWVSDFCFSFRFIVELLAEWINFAFVFAFYSFLFVAVVQAEFEADHELEKFY